MTPQLRKYIYIIWICLIAPSICHANAGLPMLFVTFPAILIALLPIIIIEAILAIPYLKVPFKKILKVMVIANLVSTLIGIPITWFLLAMIQMLTGGGGGYGLSTFTTRILAVTWQAPWLMPYRGNIHWMAPIAALVLLIPYFFVSWWIEYLIAKRICKDIDKKILIRAIRNVNFLSYGGLGVYTLIYLNIALT